VNEEGRAGVRSGEGTPPLEGPQHIIGDRCPAFYLEGVERAREIDERIDLQPGSIAPEVEGPVLCLI